MIGDASGRALELPCIWALAGVLDHRLCHRSYECEGCDLHRALRGNPPHPQSSRVPEWVPEAPLDPEGPPAEDAVDRAISAYLAHLTEDCELYLDRPHTSGHLWMQEVSSGEVLLGLDCQDLKILFPIQDILLSRPGVRLERGQAMGWVIRGTLAFPLLSPLPGEVLEVNEELLAELREHKFPKTGARWMIRLEPDGGLDELPGLLRVEAVLGWHKERLGVIRQFLRKAMDPGVGAGVTLNDGGEPNPNLEAVLGTKAFRELLDRLFSRPD